MSDDTIKPLRFPYIATLLCAACIGAAVWTCMVEASCLQCHVAELTNMSPQWPRLGQYVSVEATPGGFGSGLLSDAKPVGLLLPTELEDGRKLVSVGDHSTPYVYPVHVLLPPEAPVPPGKAVFTGRILRTRSRNKGGFVFDDVVIDISASRLFTGASIAGLVVGAMGVFVFAVALRHWLGERRKFRERDEGA